MVLWVPSWQGEECRVVWETGSTSFLFSFPSQSPRWIPEGPSVTAVALSLGLLCVEWHSKLMGKCLRLTFLCTCVTGALWPADWLCQRLTGPLLVTTRNIPLALSPGLSHALLENELALRSTSWKTQSKTSRVCFVLRSLIWPGRIHCELWKASVGLDLEKGDLEKGWGRIWTFQTEQHVTAWAEESRCS